MNSSLFDYEPRVRIGIRRVKKDILLAFIVILRSSFGPMGNSFTFGTGVPMSNNFLRPPDNQTDFFKDPKQSALLFSLPEIFRLKVSFGGHRNIRPQIIRLTLNFRLKISPSGTSNFQTLNNFAYSKFQTPNKHN